MCMSDGDKHCEENCNGKGTEDYGLESEMVWHYFYWVVRQDFSDGVTMERDRGGIAGDL